MEISVSERCEGSNERVQEETISKVIFSKKNLISVVLLVVKLITFFVRKHKSE